MVGTDCWETKLDRCKQIQMRKKKMKEGASGILPSELCWHGGEKLGQQRQMKGADISISCVLNFIYISSW